MKESESKISMMEKSVGLACPYCSCKHCPTTKTIQQEISFRGEIIIRVKRYRTCRACGLSFATVEKLEKESFPPE